MKLLQSRDENFDLCRSFLIVSMVIFHTYYNFYGLPSFHLHLVSYNTTGFILLSGFMIGVLYTERFHLNPKKNSRILAGRAFHLFIIYVVCNLAILLIYPARLKMLVALGPPQIVTAILLGTHRDITGFSILMPFVFSGLCSSFLLRILNNKNRLFYLFSFLCLLCICENLTVFNHYGIIFALVGIIGCCLGNLARDLDMDKMLKILSSPLLVIISGILILSYFAAIFYFKNSIGPYKVYLHLVPTIIIIIFVYMLSYNFKLNKSSAIRIPNQTLSKNILFAYLFHISLINTLFLIIPKHSLDFNKASLLGISILFVTMAVCYLIDYVNSKSPISKKIYLSIFKL